MELNELNNIKFNGTFKLHYNLRPKYIAQAIALKEVRKIYHIMSLIALTGFVRDILKYSEDADISHVTPTFLNNKYLGRKCHEIVLLCFSTQNYDYD